MSSEMARKFEQAFLQRVAELGQRHVAEAVGVSESTVSRVMHKKQGLMIDQIGHWCEKLGIYFTLDMADTDQVELHPRDFQALARLSMGKMQDWCDAVDEKYGREP